jgi:hypothetical protein
MEIDVRIGNESLTINIKNPYRFDLNQVVADIRVFAERVGYDLKETDLEGLIPRMIRGVAGCEAGCPADAKGLVREGFDGFRLGYIEGGILSATTELSDGRPFTLRVFPEFD